MRIRIRDQDATATLPRSSITSATGCELSTLHVLASGSVIQDMEALQGFSLESLAVIRMGNVD